MKNQYNFLKAIDTSSSSPDIINNKEATTSSSSSDGHQRPEQRKRPPSSSAAPTAPTTSSQSKPSLGRKLHNLVASKFTNISSSQQQLLADQLLPSSGNNNNNRNSRLFSLSNNTTDEMHSSKRVPLNKSHHQNNHHHHHHLPSTGQESPADLARCYEEIDQIYDYIRGLAPLPVNLRKIKSIDFEQIEREKQKLADQQRQLISQRPKQAPRLAKVRQRDASADNEAVIGPPSSPKPIKSTTSRVQVPIKLTTTGGETKRPSIKRVESLNLGNNIERARLIDTTVASSTTTTNKQSSDNQHVPLTSLFRLPRAHSTSTLNKQAGLRLQQPQNLPEETTTRTLPVARLTRQPDAQPTLTKNNVDLVESFVDDEDDETTGSSSGDNREKSSSASDQSRSSSSSSSSSEIVNERDERSSRLKAHQTSDYDNHRTSSSKDSSSPSSASSSTDTKQREARRMPEKKHEGQKSTAKQTDKLNEHIYEQIPAHKQQAASQRFSPAPGARGGPSAAANYRHHLLIEQHRRPPQQPLINYPVAYAANVAAAAAAASRRQQQQVAAFMAVQQQQQQHQQQQRRHLANLISYPLHQFTGGHSTPRGLADVAYRHRLSMSNLNMMPAYQLGQPFAQPPAYHPSQLASLSRKLNRSASSSKVNRAPRLSPAQLIAQIQMPRAVSKRQVSQQPPASTRFIWQRPLGRAQLSGQPQLQQQPVSTTNKRNSSRRLTAIGIEQAALDSVMKLTMPNLITTTAHHHQLPNGNNKSLGGNAAKQQPTRSGGYFEPPQMMKAPLIDEDEPVELPSSSSSSSNINQQAKQLIGDTRKASSGQQKNSKMAHASSGQQPVRCLNSISDLHSFSSRTTTTTTSSTGDSEEEQVEDEDDDEDDNRRQDQLGHDKSRSISKNDQGNFVSSRSFIKCYYGRESMDDVKEAKPSESHSSLTSSSSSSSSGPQALANPDKGAPNQASVAPEATPSRSQTQAKQSRRLLGAKLLGGGDRLLSLIGLDTIGSQKSSTCSTTTKKSAVQVRAKQHELVGEHHRRASAPPVGPMFAASVQKQQQTFRRHSCKPAQLVADEFLDSEGPILVRDRRVAPKADLVKHFKHATVKVARVPNFRLTDRSAQEQTKRPLPKDEAGSTGTTSSTSSYEAAIKKSDSREPAALVVAQAPSTAPPRGPGKAKSSSSTLAANQQQQSALIKVPKLSKQSHLLNRPLPRPPVGHLMSSSLSSGPTGTLRSNRSLASGRQVPFEGPTLASLQPVNKSAGSRGAADSRPASLSATATGASKASSAYRARQQISLVSTDLDEATPATKSRSSSRRQQQLPLASLTNSNGPHPSPTVTTYTSSGISSRLTAGTHLAATSSASSQRSASSKANKQRPSRSRPFNSDEEEEEEEEEEEDDDEQEDDEEHNEDERANLSESPELTGGDKTNPVNNLRLFDEKFSSKFIDHQLASSNDSLLESINFSGTLNSTRKQPTAANKR